MCSKVSFLKINISPMGIVPFCEAGCHFLQDSLDTGGCSVDCWWGWCAEAPGPGCAPLGSQSQRGLSVTGCPLCHCRPQAGSEGSQTASRHLPGASVFSCSLTPPYWPERVLEGILISTQNDIFSLCLMLPELCQRRPVKTKDLSKNWSSTV